MLQYSVYTRHNLITIQGHGARIDVDLTVSEQMEMLKKICGHLPRIIIEGFSNIGFEVEARGHYSLNIIFKLADPDNPSDDNTYTLLKLLP